LSIKVVISKWQKPVLTLAISFIHDIGGFSEFGEYVLVKTVLCSLMLVVGLLYCKYTNNGLTFSEH